MIQLTIDDFMEFCQHFEHYASQLGLQDWRVAYKFSDTDIGCNAQVHLDYTGQVASLVLNRFPDLENHDDVDLRRTACHEACEVFLHNLLVTAANHEIPKEEHESLLEAETHKVIHRLCRLMGCM